MLKKEVTVKDQFGTEYNIQATVDKSIVDLQDHSNLKYITFEGEDIRPSFEMFFQSLESSKIFKLIENTQYSASRIGGDEFVVLLPAADEAALNHCIESLHELLMVDNQFNNHQPISVSVGTATSQPNERVEDMLKRADTAMYEHKKTYYAENDRRVTNYNPTNDQ